MSKKNNKIDFSKIDPKKIFEFYAYYDIVANKIQGQAPCFIPVADKPEGLPKIVGQSKDVVKRKIVVVVL